MKDATDLTINEADLDGELEMQAEMFYRVANVAAQAESKYYETKSALDLLRAQLDRAIREAAETKMTEKAIDQEIQRNGDYQKAVRALNEARQSRDMTKALREAWYMRKDMLIQRTINKRAELEHLGSGVVKAA